MPAAIAIPLALGLGTATAGVVGAKLSSGAAEDAAGLQTNAANHAADVQAQSTADALKFQEQQAENQFQNSQTTQLANYNQSKAKYGAIAGVGAQYGLNLGPMPDYVPGVDPHYDTGATPLPGSVAGSTGGTPGAPPAAPGSIAATTNPAQGGASGLPPASALANPSAWMSLVQNPTQLAQWVQSTAPGMSPSLVNYYVGKIQGQPGANATEQAGSAQYWAQKIASDPSLGGSAAPGSVNAAASPYNAMTAPTMTAPTPTTAIPVPYQPGTIAAYGARA